MTQSSAMGDQKFSLIGAIAKSFGVSEQTANKIQNGVADAAGGMMAIKGFQGAQQFAQQQGTQWSQAQLFTGETPPGPAQQVANDTLGINQNRGAGVRM